MNNKRTALKETIKPGIIILAFLGAVVVFAALLYSEKKVLASENTVEVYVAKNQIPMGILFTEENINEYITVNNIVESLVPDRCVTDPAWFIGKNTLTGVSKGTVLTEMTFAPGDRGKEGMREPVLLSFKAEDVYQTIGGILRTGDYVHIYLQDEEGNMCLRWSNVFIESVFDSSGDVLGADEEGKALRFNIYLEKEDVEEFYDGMDSKQLRMVKVCK